MEVPAPESGEATATGKRGTGVGRAPEPPGRGRVRGRRAAGAPSWAARRLGGRARAAAVGEGRGGRSAEGGGLARCPPASRASGSRASAAPFPRCGGSPPPLPAAPHQGKPGDLPPRGGFRLGSRPPTVLGECPRRKVLRLARGAGGRAAWPWRSRVVGGARPGTGYLLRGAHGSAPGALGVPGPRSARRAGQERPLYRRRLHSRVGRQ